MWRKTWTRRCVSSLLGPALMAAVAVTMLPPMPSAIAASCDRPSAAEHVLRSDVTFFGVVRKSARSPSTANAERATIEMDIIRAYKGVIGETATIRFLNDAGSGSGGWGFHRGWTGLVFARRAGASMGMSEEPGVDGYVGYCTMMPYHGQPQLHPDFWEELSRLAGRRN